MSTGIDYSSGKYGDSRHTETLYVPLGLKYEVSDWTLRATIPYVESSGPSDVVGQGTDRITLGTSGNSHRKAAGLGDVVLSVGRTIYQQGPWLLELATRIKLATASEKDGLGTGKNDYSLQAEVYRSIERHTLFGTLGAKKMGDPEGTPLKDPIYASVGWSMKAASSTSLGLSYDYRQKVQESGAPIREATAFLTQKLDDTWKVQAYLVTGYSKASPDLGGGLFVFYAY